MDIIDRGNVLAELHLNHALKQHNAGKKEALQEIFGYGEGVICHDCGSVIDWARVHALRGGGMPALRCIECQRIYERKKGRKWK